MPSSNQNNWCQIDSQMIVKISTKCCSVFCSTTSSLMHKREHHIVMFVKNKESRDCVSKAYFTLDIIIVSRLEFHPTQQ